MRLLVAPVLVVLLVAALPAPAAAQATWRVDATVAVVEGTNAQYTWRIDGLANTNLTLPVPDNATFVEATEDGGDKLRSGTVGDDVWVVSKSKPFSLRFRLAGQRDGPFVVFPAQVASASDSPVSVGITVPPGWAVVGSRNNDEDAPRDMEGRFHHTGPAYVQWLVLEDGAKDIGPDRTVFGSAVRRIGNASVGLDGIAWTLVTTYDTDIYSRTWEVHLPEGATAVSATTPFGPATTERDGDVLRVTTPYPVGYGLGGRPFTVSMQLPAPESFGGAFRQANLSIRAGDGDRVSIDVALAPGLRYAGARLAGGAETAPLHFASNGPLSASIAFLPPARPGNVQFDEGLFVVDAPQELANAARATARNATELLPKVAAFAYEDETRPFFVSYTAAPIFGWEQGFYSNGLNTISIRASTLANATDGSARLVPVGVLVHEATHGLVDRRMPDAPHGLSFLHEGLARLAEAGIEPMFPSSEIVACRQEFLREQCERHSARPAADEIQTYHREGRVFEVGWEASKVPDADRGFLYDYSGLVLRAFHLRAPVGALDNAMLTLARTTFVGDDEAQAATVLGILLANAPGTSEAALLYPGREAYGLTEGQFAYCMGSLVAPPYPWEERDVRAPPGGCPATGYGPRTGELPPPPQEPTPTPIVEADPEPAPSPTPFVLTTPGRGGTTTLPPEGTPTGGGVDTGTGAPSDPEAPGAVVGEPQPPGSTVPGASVLALLAAFAAAALVLTRRR